MWRVATDIGGTFTDIAFCEVDEARGTAGPIHAAKVDTVAGDLAAGVLAAINAAAIDPREIAFFAHGSTVVINALTERQGTPSGLITTRGFRDVLEIARGNRPDLYNFRYRKPPPFVPRRHRLEVDERVDARGNIVRALDPQELDRVVEQLRAAGIRALAVCFLHAWANPANEIAALERIRARWPEVAVVASHQACREWREYERTSTTVLAAYVAPVAGRYLGALATRLAARGVPAAPLIMQSNGGVATIEVARRNPIALVESGPASGVIGAALLARAIGRENVIALDIGGTTAKCSLIASGRPAITTDYAIEASRTSPGYPIRVPVIDIVEIGTGGGSLARLDAGGRLHVGPESAGANPGPVVYGRGGRIPTVTDAQVLTGRIDPEAILAGAGAARLGAVEAAFARLGGQLGTDPRATACGVLRLAETGLENALKLVSIQRGHDPRDFALVAFGGGGPLHGAALAAALRIPEVIVPPQAAAFSALGMLLADLRRDFVRTRLIRLDRVAPGIPARVWAELEAEATDAYRGDGIASDRLLFERLAEMRYRGQEHTLRVALGGGAVDGAALLDWAERFRVDHERQYRLRLDRPVELVTFHLVAHGRMPRPSIEHSLGPARRIGEARRGFRQIDFDAGSSTRTPVHDRGALAPGMAIEGPALVEETGTVTLIWPDQRATLDGYGNLVIDVTARSEVIGEPGGGHD